MLLSECCGAKLLDDSNTTCSRCGMNTGFCPVCDFCGATIEYDPQTVIEPGGTQHIEANPYCPECSVNS